MRRPVGGTLVETHRVRETDIEQTVVAGRGSFEDVAEGAALLRGQLFERRHMPSCDHHGFERPDGPERDHGQEMVVLFDDPFALVLLESRVLAEEAGTTRLAPGE